MRKMHSKEELEALASGGGGVSYSTEEQDTGLTWIDGKKIYQRTFVKTNIAEADTEVLIAQVGSTLNVIEITGFTDIEGTISPLDSQVVESGTTYTATVVFVTGLLMLIKSQNAIDNLYVTIKYTK